MPKTEKLPTEQQAKAVLFALLIFGGSCSLFGLLTWLSIYLYYLLGKIIL